MNFPGKMQCPLSGSVAFVLTNLCKSFTLKIAMPIPKRWSKFTHAIVDSAPAKAGIYELGNSNGEVVYIGSSEEGEDIRGRLRFHKKKNSRSVRYFRFLLAGLFQNAKAMEQHHCELFKARYGRLPRLQKRMPKGYLPLF